MSNSLLAHKQKEHLSQNQGNIDGGWGTRCVNKLFMSHAYSREKVKLEHNIPLLLGGCLVLLKQLDSHPEHGRESA
jgi:hypothetical protein